jgi:hypothetical protein
LVPCNGGICTAIRCDIDGQDWAAGLKPGNDCQYCLPSRNPAIPDAWRPIPAGTDCGDLEATACSTAAATCNGEGECVPSNERDGTLCGPGQTCCNGRCCTSTQCCNAAGVCEECGPHCVIDYVTHLDGAGRPDGSCNVCDPTNFSFWTTAPNTFACGPNRDQACCNGACCDPGECCGPTGQCEACEPECTVNGSWCGSEHNQACCNGQCCAFGAYGGHSDSCACCAPGEQCDGGICEPW